MDTVERYVNDVGTEAASKHEVVDEAYAVRYKFPLKIVFTAESTVSTVATTYPLKGKRKQ